jgi:hypothetical protein
MRGRGYRFRLALTLFAGCLTWPLAALAFTSAAQPAVAAGQACLNTVYRSPDYAALLPHIPADIGAVTARQLADPAFVTPQEIAAIGATHPRLQQCREALLGALTRAEPLLVPILNTAFAKSDGDLAALVERKIAWGEYARRLRGRAAQTRSLIEEAERIAASDTKKADAGSGSPDAESSSQLPPFRDTYRSDTGHCRQYGRMADCNAR